MCCRIYIVEFSFSLKKSELVCKTAYLEFFLLHKKLLLIAAIELELNSSSQFLVQAQGFGLVLQKYMSVVHKF